MVTPSGELVDVLRVQTKSADEKAAVVHISQDGRIASFDPTAGFIKFPGGAKKFTIRFDPKSEKFQTWAIPGGGDIVRNMDVLPNGNPVTANSLVNQVGMVEVK